VAWKEQLKDEDSLPNTSNVEMLVLLEALIENLA
jgi:hypothetical protein